MENLILENDKKFFIHPIYKKYAGNKDGEIINVRIRKPMIGNIKNSGYLSFCIPIAKNKIKNYLSHRFIYECFYGLIEENKFINHINFIKTDNRLKNLELVTTSENNKKSVINRDYSFVKNNHKNKKKVKGINLLTKEEVIYNSLYLVNKLLAINAGHVKMICEDKYKYCKSATSKKDGQKYTFEYIKLGLKN